MKYKVLAIINKGSFGVNEAMAQATAYYATRVPFAMDFTSIEVDNIDINHSPFINTSAGGAVYGTKGVKEQLRAECTKRGINVADYDAVTFFYDETKTKIYNMLRIVSEITGKLSYITSWTFFDGMNVGNTEYSEILANKVYSDSGNLYVSLIHETMHQFCKHLARKGTIVKDEMDSTMVNGVSIPYYKNDNPEATDGNFAITLRNINGNAINIPDFKAPTPTPTPTPTPPVDSWPYKYFLKGEPYVAGLAPSLLTFLDSARDLAGVPFVLTSGLRTKESNKGAGGVSNSAHLKGLAVDIYCKDNSARFKIVKGLQATNIPCFIEVTGHVHVDLDSSIHALNQMIPTPKK